MGYREREKSRPEEEIKGGGERREGQEEEGKGKADKETEGEKQTRALFADLFGSPHSTLDC